jgi:hypothetical protein
MMNMVFLVFSAFLISVFLVWAIRRPPFQKMDEKKEMIFRIHSSIGENFPVFLIKITLYIILIFILNFYQLWEKPVFLTLPILIIVFSIWQLSGYRYK